MEASSQATQSGRREPLNPLIVMDGLAHAAIGLYPLSAATQVRLLNYSENYTYLLDCPSAGRHILRINRPGYHSAESVQSELKWLDALTEQCPITTARALCGFDGQRIQELRHPETGETIRCVLFEFLEGEAPSEDNLAEEFEKLGEVTAHLHNQVACWPPSRRLTRLVWDFEHTLGATPNWGRWQDGLGMTPQRAALLGRAVDVIRGRLAAYGTAADRYGLIHADLRLANLLVHEGQIRVIDFDDCGFGWFMYDLASALSFIEHTPIVPDLVANWLKGYRKVLPLASEHEAEIPTFIMLRRMLLVAWIGSHCETNLAREMGETFTAGTCRLAREYLEAYAPAAGESSGRCPCCEPAPPRAPWQYAFLGGGGS